MFHHWNFSVNIGSNSLPWNFLVSGLHSHITVTSYNERDGVSNHLRLECLPNRLFRRRSNEASKLRVSGLCEGNSPVTKEFPAQRASNAENVSIWWRHHELGYVSRFMTGCRRGVWCPAPDSPPKRIPCSYPSLENFSRILDEKRTLFNRNRWFWGPIKHHFLKKNAILFSLYKIKYPFCETDVNCIKHFFCVHCIFHYV